MIDDSKLQDLDKNHYYHHHHHHLHHHHHPKKNIFSCNNNNNNNSNKNELILKILNNKNGESSSDISSTIKKIVYKFLLISLIYNVLWRVVLKFEMRNKKNRLNYYYLSVFSLFICIALASSLHTDNYDNNNSNSNNNNKNNRNNNQETNEHFELQTLLHASNEKTNDTLFPPYHHISSEFDINFSDDSSTNNINNKSGIGKISSKEANQIFNNNNEIYSLPVKITLSSLATMASLTTISGNLLVMCSFFLDRQIRNPTNYFILSLSVSDFLIGLFSMPLYTLYLMLGKWPFGKIICNLWLSLDYTVCLTSIYTVLFITIDRFCSVKIPAKYRKWRSPNKIIVMVALTWAIPISLFFTSIFAFSFNKPFDPNDCSAAWKDNVAFSVGLVISYFWTTLIVMIILYIFIYQVARNLERKSREKQRKLSSLVGCSASNTGALVGVVALPTTMTNAVNKFNKENGTTTPEEEHEDDLNTDSQSKLSKGSIKRRKKDHLKFIKRTSKSSTAIGSVGLVTVTGGTASNNTGTGSGVGGGGGGGGGVGGIGGVKFKQNENQSNYSKKPVISSGQNTNKDNNTNLNKSNINNYNSNSVSNINNNSNNLNNTNITGVSKLSSNQNIGLNQKLLNDKRINNNISNKPTLKSSNYSYASTISKEDEFSSSYDSHSDYDSSSRNKKSTSTNNENNSSNTNNEPIITNTKPNTNIKIDIKMVDNRKQPSKTKESNDLAMVIYNQQQLLLQQQQQLNLQPRPETLAVMSHDLFAEKCAVKQSSTNLCNFKNPTPSPTPEIINNNNKNEQSKIILNLSENILLTNNNSNETKSDKTATITTTTTTAVTATTLNNCNNNNNSNSNTNDNSVNFNINSDNTNGTFISDNNNIQNNKNFKEQIPYIDDEFDELSYILHRRKFGDKENSKIPIKEETILIKSPLKTGFFQKISSPIKNFSRRNSQKSQSELNTNTNDLNSKSKLEMLTNQFLNNNDKNNTELNQNQLKFEEKSSSNNNNNNNNYKRDRNAENEEKANLIVNEESNNKNSNLAQLTNATNTTTSSTTKTSNSIIRVSNHIESNPNESGNGFSNTNLNQNNKCESGKPIDQIKHKSNSFKINENENKQDILDNASSKDKLLPPPSNANNNASSKITPTSMTIGLTTQTTTTTLTSTSSYGLKVPPSSTCQTLDKQLSVQSGFNATHKPSNETNLNPKGPKPLQKRKTKYENRARKALRTITFILGAFVFCFAPFHVISVLDLFCLSCKNSSFYLHLFNTSYFLCYLNSPINPLMYALANQQFRKTFFRILRGDWRRL